MRLDALGGSFINRDFRGDNRPRETRVNERIRAREVRLIDEDGQVVGVMPPAQALALARERDVDLVEVSPMAVPPVCRLMDWGRYKYEQSKKENEARKHQKVTELKEIRMRPRTDDHDLNVKVRKIEEFLADGDKVKVSVLFRGREMAHPELGRVLLDKIVAELKGIAQIERAPLMEGRSMSMFVSRAPGYEPPKKAAPQTRERKNNRPSDGPAATDDSASDDEDEVAAPEVDAVEPVTPTAPVASATTEEAETSPSNAS
jgi:translation initiation factor IF-3